jgi:hypothetical protein
MGITRKHSNRTRKTNMKPSLSNIPLRIVSLAAAAGILPTLLPAVSRAANNTYYGAGALATGSTSGVDDSAFGVNALNLDTSGYYNTAVGFSALKANTTGIDNTATGLNALMSNKIGAYNSAYGVSALAANTTGTGNTATGNQALAANTTGTGNTATGYQALFSCTTDSQDTATGFQALFSDTVAFSGLPNQNVADGYRALYMNTDGYANAAGGYEALYHNLQGDQNTAFGYEALNSSVNAILNTAVGYEALLHSTGNANIAVGHGSGQNITTGGFNIDIGHPGFGADNKIIRIGDGTTQTDTYLTGVIHGNGSGLTGIPGLNTAGTSDLGVGISALSNDGGEDNTAVGAGALPLNSGNYNNAEGAGSMAGNSVSGSDDVGIGAFTLYELTQGNDNDAMGYNALYSNSTGFDNVGLGSYALVSNTSGYENTAVGIDAMEDMTSGRDNVALGVLAGANLTTGYNNVYLASIGGPSSENGTMYLGTIGTQTTTYIAGSTVGINTTSPTAGTLDFNGSFIVAEGGEGVRPYIGDDGSGKDVQIGSLTSGITSVACYNETDGVYMHLYCSSITIEGGADLAEPFRISKAKQPIEDGDVVVIDKANPGGLTLADKPYDTRVAGVVSGANGVHPGIQMQQQGLLDGGKNVALSGRVYVQADTSNGPIEPGDMLTTSPTPGHAMKVTDHGRAEGAILGKAMSSLGAGSGTVLVLVTLQ